MTPDEVHGLTEAAAFLKARRYAEGEAAIGPVTASVVACHIRAECRIGLGRLDEAAADYDAALGWATMAGGLWVSRADLELWRDGLAGWERIVDRALARPVLPPENLHLLVRKACLLWMRREVSECAAVLGHLSQELVRQGAALAQVLQGYTFSTAVHLRGLLAAEAAGRGGHYDTDPALPPVFLLGDSHCIGPAGSIVPIGGRAHRVVPLYVLGCKAWHLAQPGANPYKACAMRLAGRMPAGSAVIVSAGDIDCRVRSGFDNLRRRTGGDVGTAIRGTVAGYLDWVRAAVGPAMVLTPPGRRAELIADGGDRAAMVAIDRQFRAALAEGCARRGLVLVDYGALTLREDGGSAPEWFVDAHHLAGGALRAALSLAGAAAGGHPAGNG